MSTLAGVAGVAVGVNGASQEFSGKPLVGVMTVSEFNQALAALANDIKIHINDALISLKSDIVTLTKKLEGINSNNPYPLGIKETLELYGLTGMAGMDLDELNMRLDNISKRVELIKSKIGQPV
jgi:hypothetical protein